MSCSSSQQPPLADTPVTVLKGVGNQLAKKLEKLSIYSVQDVLFHLPYRYEDRTRIHPLVSLKPGMIVTIEGRISHVQAAFFKGKRSLTVTLAELGAQVSIKFFHFSNAQKEQMEEGALMRCFGEVRRGPRGYSMIHPEYLVLQDSQEAPLNEHLTPIYPITEGLKLNRITTICQQACVELGNVVVPELIPDTLLPKECGTWETKEAIAFLHQPSAESSPSQLENMLHPAQIRLVIEELVAHQLSRLHKKQERCQLIAKPLHGQSRLHDAYLATLPFSPTAAQARVFQEISGDITKSAPMLRLVQGDVGSGKTWVAAMTALSAIASGCQVALMAPTEILAEQHFETFQQWFSTLNINTGFLVSKMSKAKKTRVIQSLQSGEITLAIGTHALFQESVQFKNLGLVIIDEQHRFGVHQRLSLYAKGADTQQVPHQLVMTATPIPRTLAMTAYAEMDKSIIDELPPGRSPVTTVAVDNKRRPLVIERVAAACAQGRQVYWVCTLIEESEQLQCQAAEKTAEALQAQLTQVKIGLIHGRMKPQEKQETIDAFKTGEIQLLVATTVIEVGVNVPNASLMIIENPERLGLAQLHQLRGRVGRGAIESHCVLLYHSPLSKNGKARISIMRDTNDGFRIAEEDLKIRGPGEILGTKQTGIAQYKIADLMRDKRWHQDSQQIAKKIQKHYPHLIKPLIQRWLGVKTQYHQV